MKLLVAGATGFVGSALVPALLAAGHQVRACSRHVVPDWSASGLEHVRCDLLDGDSLAPALSGVEAAYYLVHSLGGAADFREIDRRAAHAFAGAAAAAGVRRIIYLGGVEPRGRASEHLASRLEVGRILRAGRVPTLELRAAMIVGQGSASWQIVRDLALRLPAMVLPAWLESQLAPIALEDAVQALVDGLSVPLPESDSYDIPGPDTMTGKQILERIAALEGRRLVTVSLPWLTPRLSALWLRLVTRANFALARELVFGLTGDLLPRDRRYYDLTGHPPRLSFVQAASAAIEQEHGPPERHGLGAIEESLVRRLGPRLRV
ncbi:MAG TPA: NAD(P)H-binding protein [Polyangia bacterium]|jgi:uncharacterized protein YbjT (DUF2867 family)|nr:NAD(P)H-binding protein [Polyangia bacterium]